MSGRIIHSWTFDVTEPDEVKGSLRSRGPPAGDVRFITEDEGKDEQVYREDNLLGINLARYVRAIPSLLAGDSAEIELDASTVRLTPQQRQGVIEVYVDMYGVPDEARGYTPDKIATEAFVLEVYETCLAWHDEAKEIEPDLSREEWFTELYEALTAALASIREADISSALDEPT